MGKRSSDVFIIGEEGLLADEDPGRDPQETAPDPERVEEGDWSPFDPDEGEWREAEVRRSRPRWLRGSVVAVAGVIAVALVVSRLAVSATSAVVPTRSVGAHQALVEAASPAVRRRRKPRRRPAVRRHVQRSGRGAPVHRRGAPRHHRGSVPRHSLHTGEEKVAAGAPEGREPSGQEASVSVPVVTPAPEPVVTEPAPEPVVVESAAESPPPAPVSPVEGRQERTGADDFGFER